MVDCGIHSVDRSSRHFQFRSASTVDGCGRDFQPMSRNHGEDRIDIQIPLPFLSVLILDLSLIQEACQQQP